MRIVFNRGKSEKEKDFITAQVGERNILFKNENLGKRF